MKVLTIGATYGGGGPGGTAKLVHLFLSQNGVESRMICAVSNSGDKNVKTVYNRFELALFRLGKRFFRAGAKAVSRLATGRVLKEISRFGPDVVHIRVIHHDYFAYKPLFRRLAEANVPVVFSLHDLWLTTGGCYHFLDVGCDGYVTGCRGECPKPDKLLDCPKKDVADEWRTKKELVSGMKEVVTVSVSEWVSRCAASSYLNKYRNVLIYNSVDTDLFYPRGKAGHAGHTVVGSANMWSALKGLDDFNRLADLLPDGYEIRLIGNIPAGFELSPKIKPLGHIGSKDELAKLYSDADVFVHLSRQETFGLVIAEAACCGKITVGYDISAIPEVLGMAKGVAVPFGDLRAVADSVVSVCESGRELSGDELESVRTAFSKERLVREHLELYKSIAKDRRCENDFQKTV